MHLTDSDKRYNDGEMNYISSRINAHLFEKIERLRIELAPSDDEPLSVSAVLRHVLREFDA